MIWGYFARRKARILAEEAARLAVVRARVIATEKPVERMIREMLERMNADDKPNQFRIPNKYNRDRIYR
jgi:hypothetical protein